MKGGNGGRGSRERERGKETHKMEVIWLISRPGNTVPVSGLSARLSIMAYEV